MWLASFPRSGNTFVRNILFEVYGIKSSAFRLDKETKWSDIYTELPVVKTHYLPKDVEPPIDSSVKVACLIRDGRDALISTAHHRKDIVEPGSDFRENLKTAILASGDSHFGGWSENVRQWADIADVVVRYEDLVEDPIRETEKFRAILDMPEPDIAKLPTLDSQRNSENKYGKFKRHENRSKLFFRRGVAGAWKDEMPDDLHELFWEYHHEMMIRFNYTEGIPQKYL